MQQAHDAAAPDAAQVLERELAVLARSIELMARRSDLYLGLDRASYLILFTLEAGGPSSINALAMTLGLDGSTVTRQVAAMEADGLIAREADPRDRRTSIVRATAHGLDRMREVRARRQARIGILLGEWTPEERSSLARLLGKLNGVIARAAAEGRASASPTRRPR
jgi:DNA-binding MarR family transcriptional regulator